LVDKRGGSWNDIPQNLRAAVRLRNTTVSREIDIGFRLARTIP
jgi:formylglycine-generating enzyme required for sulfatase activity